MSARRDYGSGSVYMRKDGRWVGAISRGWTEQGARRRITVTAKTQAEAKRRLRQKVNELDAGAAVEASSRKTVKAWAEEWLPIVEREQRPNTFNGTRTAVTRWIVPTIGHKRLADLTPSDVRAVADAQRKAGVNSTSQLRRQSVLMSLLKAAQAEGYAIAPRVLAVKPPAKAATDRTDVPVDDAVRMLEKAAEDPAGARWVAAFLQGLRQGEALGLTRDAVDLERGILTLSWQLQPLPYRVPRDPSSGFRVPDDHEAKQVRGRWHLVRPKSSAGWRVIPLLPWMTSALQAWFEVMPESPHGLIWYHPKGDPPKLDDAAWYALQDACGVRHPTRLDDDGKPAPFTIHEARHTTATLLLEADVDLATIEAILGHASYVSSRAYLHVRTDRLTPALEKVADRLALG